MFDSTAAVIAIALLIIILILLAIISVRISKINVSEPITKSLLLQFLREESDGIRRSGDEQSRSIRSDIVGGLDRVQTTTMTSFAVLSDGLATQLRDFSEKLDRSMVMVEQRVAAIGEKLDRDISNLGISAEQNRDKLRILVENKLDAAASKHGEEAFRLREELNLSFNRLNTSVAANMLDMGERQKERLAQTNTALADLSDKHEKAGETLKSTVESRLDRLREENTAKLDEMRQTVDEKLQSTLETRLGESFNRVVEQLNRVHEGLGEMKSLASNVGDLKNVLTNVKIRGTYGEVQLAMLMEQFLTREQYIKDAQVREHSSERVEFALRMPGGGPDEEVLIPIDAKFPRETYDRLVDASQAGDEEAVKSHRKRLEAEVRSCAKTICEKYINPPVTTNFAILFLPTESLYAEVLRQVGVFEGIQRDYHVTLAGPTTLAALLNALQMGFRSLAIERRSGEVWKVLGAVRTEFGKYNDVVARLGKNLSTAANSVELLGRRTRAMDRRLRGVELSTDNATASTLLGLEDEETGALGIEPVIASTGEAVDPIGASDAVAGTA